MPPSDLCACCRGAVEELKQASNAIFDRCRREQHAEKDADAASDTARLDWLDRNLKMRIGWKFGIAPAGNICSTTAIVTDRRQTPTNVRAAIDATRGAHNAD